MLKQHPLRDYNLIFIALIVLCLPAIQPFTLGQMPRTDDGTLHLYRSIALDYSLQVDGTLWPRYSSGLVYGYGAPLFNYFPPTAYYPTVVLHRLGMAYLPAWLATMSGFIILSAVGAFLLGQQWTNRAGGFVAATAYVYAPYMLFDTVARGTITEVAALALLPVVLWALARLARTAQATDFALAVINYALFILMHNIITVHGSILIAAFCAWLWLTSDRRWRTFGVLLLAGVSAVLVTTFFWLPALTETHFTRIEGVTQNLDFVDVTNTLRPLTAIFALPHTADPTQLQQPTPITLGWLSTLLALGAVFLTTGRQRSLAYFWWGVTVVVVFMNTPLSAWFWQHIPLIGFSQFAWRTLGLASLALAILSAITVSSLLIQIASEWRKLTLFCVVIAALVIYSMSWLYRPYIVLEARSLADAHEHERQTGELALSSYSEYLPMWHDGVLDPTLLQSQFQQSPFAVDRLVANEAITVDTATWTGTAVMLNFSAVAPTKLVFNWLYVPGWRAAFQDEPSDGLALTVRPTQPLGLVSVEVPTGNYTLRVWLDQTENQRLSWFVSAFSVSALTVLLAAWIWFKPFKRVQGVQENNRIRNISFIHIVMLCGLVLFLFKALVIDHTQNSIRSTRLIDGQITGLRTLLNADFGGSIQLLGVELPEAVELGRTAQIRLFWRLAGESLERDYSSILHLRDAMGHIVAEAGSIAPGHLATRHWLPDYYLEEVVELVISPYTPPNDYVLDVGLFDAQTLNRLNVINAVGNPIDVKFELGTIQIMSPSHRMLHSVSSVLYGAEAIGIVPVDMNLPESLMVGEQLQLKLRWSARHQTTRDYAFRLVWRGLSDEMIPVQAILPSFPTSQWQAGDVWDMWNTSYVPATLQAGIYKLNVEVLNPESDMVGHYTLGEIQISEPERQYTVTDIQRMIEAKWQNGVVLKGINSVSTLTLYWQTLRLIDADLRLFVHVVDGERTLAQTDGIPVDWTRPTTGWVVNEWITTLHDFDLPAGTYTLRIGWYDPVTGNRVLLDNGDDALSLQVNLP